MKLFKGALFGLFACALFGSDANAAGLLRSKTLPETINGYLIKNIDCVSKKDKTYNVREVSFAINDFSKNIDCEDLIFSIIKKKTDDNNKRYVSIKTKSQIKIYAKRLISTFFSEKDKNLFKIIQNNPKIVFNSDEAKHDVLVLNLNKEEDLGEIERTLIDQRNAKCNKDK